MPNPEIWRWAGKGAAKLRGRKQTKEHKAKRAASVSRTLAKTRRVCVHCGDEFTPTQAAQKYCSGRCWNAVARRKKARKQKVICPPALYEELAAKQLRQCAICGRPSGTNGRKDRLAVDHCHTENRIRGLLCHRCNTALGLLQDSPALLRRAAEYLDSPPFWVEVPLATDSP